MVMWKRQDYQWLFPSSILHGFLLQNVTVRFRRPLCTASTSLPNLEEENGNHDPEVKTNDLKEVVNKLIPESIGKDI